jgi:triacylglycerol esterase/lipase EstA (alpha/beta hydrolase family)
MRKTRLAGVLGAIVGLALLGSGVAQAAPASHAAYPVDGNIAEGIAQSLPNPAASPAGVNVACTPSAAHPRPVVLVNGTFSNMIDDWSGLGPTLANAGYCVYDVALGASPSSVIQTYGAVATSANQLASFVDSVLSRTGASQVDLVGHSQGGMLAEYYTKLLGGAAKVHTVVGLSPTTHGTTLDGLGALAAAFPGGPAIVGLACPACADQLIGSKVITTLDNGPIAQPGVNYTVIETHNETVVTPAGSSFIQEPGVTDEWVQDYCAFDIVDHVSLPYDHTVYTLVKNALDPAHATRATC